MFEYIPDIIQGLPTSLSLTIISLLVALVLALLFTIVLTLRPVVLTQLVQGYITLFTGTPLLVQIFLIYYGPGQFDWIKQTPWLWNMLSQPWLCAMVALALNSAAYTTQLFYGAVKQSLPDNGSLVKHLACLAVRHCVFCCRLLSNERCRLIPTKSS